MPRGSGRNARLFDPQPDACLSAPAQRRLGPRDRFGHAGVVDGMFGAKTCHGRVNRVLLVTPPRQPVANPGFGQLVPRQHLQTVEISLLRITWRHRSRRILRPALYSAIHPRELTS